MKQILVLFVILIALTGCSINKQLKTLEHSSNEAIVAG